jgi:hypothetical protein
MHRISENLIFNTKSPQIFSPAVRCGRFGAILAVHFTIKGAQSIPSIIHLISLPKLSQFLSQSLSNSASLSLSILGPAAKVEEIRSSLSPVGKSLSQALSPSLSLCLSLGYTVKEEEEEEKKKKKENGKEKEMIFSFFKVLF